MHRESRRVPVLFSLEETLVALLSALDFANRIEGFAIPTAATNPFLLLFYI